MSELCRVSGRSEGYGACDDAAELRSQGCRGGSSDPGREQVRSPLWLQMRPRRICLTRRALPMLFFAGVSFRFVYEKKC